MFSQYDDIVTVDDLMEMLGIGRNQAYSLLQSGQIKSIKVGRAYRIPKVCVRDFILTKVQMNTEQHTTDSK
ncbi:helix-turn-helix domain-containing protein [Brevibacillus parabrevis]|uniref:helix-turn-helix domain-containing protein n=1 Tax=Brevibacillus parabrevis TaxID=54914 RepID=UPI00285342B9|nr:helix-turn-helix domain-containing protein [Brevibacillus parabrevis]MDR5000427.1 helix-turn-helix domain-containing protein [Brevibacillus parabrevis]